MLSRKQSLCLVAVVVIFVAFSTYFSLYSIKIQSCDCPAEAKAENYVVNTPEIESGDCKPVEIIKEVPVNMPVEDPACAQFSSGLHRLRAELGLSGDWKAEYAAFHANAITPSTPAHESKYLVYDCQGGCGGMGSRFWGICHTFLLALSSNRVFYIDNAKPKPLTLGFKGRCIDWAYNPKRIGTLDMKRLGYLDRYPKADKLNYESQAPAKWTPADGWAKPVLRIKGANMNLELWKNPFLQHIFEDSGTTMSPIGYDKFGSGIRTPICGAVFDYLLAPSDAVQGIIEDVGSRFKGKFVVSMHVRVAQSKEYNDALKDFFKKAYAKLDWFYKCADKLQMHTDKPVAWFLATDSEIVQKRTREEAEKRGVEVIMVAEGKRATHLDRSKGVTNQEYINTSADWFLIQLADRALLSKSSFSMTGANAFHRNWIVVDGVCE